MIEKYFLFEEGGILKAKGVADDRKIDYPVYTVQIQEGVDKPEPGREYDRSLFHDAPSAAQVNPGNKLESRSGYSIVYIGREE